MVTRTTRSGRRARYICIGTPEQSAECEERIAAILLRGLGQQSLDVKGTVLVNDDSTAERNNNGEQ